MNHDLLDSRASTLGNDVETGVATVHKPSRAIRQHWVGRSLRSEYSESLGRSDDDGDDDTLSTLEPPMQSFWMEEEDKVEAFLLQHIDALQQLSLKQISKEWIKVICPKKQANYSYRNTKVKSKTNKKPKVPGWWPDEKVCQWREPDHVKKDQRNRLVLHLLRLRPTAAQLELWNRDNFQATDMHKFADWTTFLEGVIPNLDNIPPVTKARVQNRRQLLKKIYTVARMEEEYKKFDMNGQYHYKEEVKASV
ncbi:hypothetical protein LTS12_028440, partial [Elasticomyces elasticus]